MDTENYKENSFLQQYMLLYRERVDEMKQAETKYGGSLIKSVDADATADIGLNDLLLKMDTEHYKENSFLQQYMLLYSERVDQMKQAETKYEGSLMDCIKSVDADATADIGLNDLLLKMDTENYKENSFLQQYMLLYRERVDQMKEIKTKYGGSLMDCIKSGLSLTHSKIGVYACDPDAYVVFRDLMEFMVKKYSMLPLEAPLPVQTFSWDISRAPVTHGTVDRRYILSTRIRLARNIDGFPFSPTISKEKRLEIERMTSNVLNNLSGCFKGKYETLASISQEKRQSLVQTHLLFKSDDKYLDACGACRDWPSGRGVFLNKEKTFIVWVNEEDHLRIICLKEGEALKECFRMLHEVHDILRKKLNFSRDETLGYLTSCPSNLGTGMRISVHIRLSELQKLSRFRDICNTLHLDIRGVHGEHSEAEDGVYDISNKIRFGMTEKDIYNQVVRGINVLCCLEKSLEENRKHLKMQT